MHAEIDALVATQVDGKGPGAAVAAIKSGEVVHAKGYGLANLEWDIPIDADTVFRLASLTKQFTATAIVLLERDGRLSLDDPLAKFLPEYPTQGHDVRVRHLLTHTSGIKSYTSLDGFFENVSRKDMTPQQVLDLVKDLPFEFAPGERYDYCNTGYMLLGLIIEQASGQGYEEFLRERIFAPLGMNDTRYLHNEPIVPRRASGYHPGEGGSGFVNAPFLSMTQPHAAGALGSTLNDLIRWDAALREGRLIDRPTLDLMYTSATLSDGRDAGYGFGWGVGSYEGHRVAHHGGGINGFSTYIARFPDDQAAVIVLANSVGINGERLARQISRLLLGLPAISRASVPLDAAVAAMAAGTYAAPGFGFEIAHAEGRLTIFGDEPLAQLDATTFCLANDEEVVLRFGAAEDGRFYEATIKFPFYPPTTARRSP